MTIRNVMLTAVLLAGLQTVALATQETPVAETRSLPLPAASETAGVPESADVPPAVPLPSLSKVLPPLAVAPPLMTTDTRAVAAMTTDTFLDKLMMAESGGRSDAKNPRSTALGPFQFIESTFLEVVRRHFVQDVAGLSDRLILSLRTDREFSRRIAHAFSQDNAAALTAEKVPVTFPNLRLAFLLGPTAAIRVLQAPPENPLGPLVGSSVVFANPFMATMTAGDLAARAARDLALPAPRFVARSRFAPPGGAVSAGLQPAPLPSSPIAQTAHKPAAPAARARRQPQQPALVVLCNRDLPSCKRWVALQTRVLAARGGPSRRGLASAQR